MRYLLVAIVAVVPSAPNANADGRGGTNRSRRTFMYGGQQGKTHDQNLDRLSDACGQHRSAANVTSERPVAGTFPTRAGIVGSGIGAGDSGAISPAPERGSRSRAWGKYRSGSVRNDVSRVAVELGIAVKEMMP